MRRPEPQSRFAARCARWRRGSTLLEVILAAALLAGVAGAVVQALSGMAAGAERRRNMMGAYETANRLLLQYIDDKDKMPDGSVPYFDGVNYFRWELLPLEMNLEVTENGATAPSASNPQSLATIRQAVILQVNVYLSDEQGTVYEQLASIIRPFHPWPLFSPNPNMAARWMADPKNINDLTSALMGATTGAASSRTPPPSLGGKGSGSGTTGPSTRPPTRPSTRPDSGSGSGGRK